MTWFILGFAAGFCAPVLIVVWFLVEDRLASLEPLAEQVEEQNNA